VLRAAQAVDNGLATAIIEDTVPNHAAIEFTEWDRLRTEVAKAQPMIIRELASNPLDAQPLATVPT
jgi:hypothetical protein